MHARVISSSVLKGLTISQWNQHFFLHACLFLRIHVRGIKNSFLTVTWLNTNCLFHWFCFSHFAVTSNPTMWRVVGHIHDFLNGGSYYVWVYQVRSIPSLLIMTTAEQLHYSLYRLRVVRHSSFFSRTGAGERESARKARGNQRPLPEKNERLLVLYILS